MRVRISNTGSIVLLLLLFPRLGTNAQDPGDPDETRIILNKTTIEWNQTGQKTQFSNFIVFRIGSKEAFADLYYSDSFSGKGNIKIRNCYYQKPGEKKEKVPKDWVKISNAFEEYILYSDRYVVEWTMKNLPIGTIVELDYSTTYDRFLDFISIPLQNYLDVDSTVISFVHQSDASLALHLYNSDSINTVKSDRQISLGSIPKWEARPYDGGYRVSAAMLYCHIESNSCPYHDWRQVASTIQYWWSNTNLSLPVKKLSDSDLELIQSIPERYDLFEKAFRYVAIVIGGHEYIPHEPKDVFKYKYGDCKDLSLLFCHICRWNGVEAFPVIVSTPFKNPFFESIPTPYQFNHCIVAYLLDQDTVYYDPTSRGYAVGELPWSLQGAYALWLCPDAAGIITLPRDPDPIEFERTLKGELLSSGDFKGSVDFHFDKRLPKDIIEQHQENELMDIVRKNFNSDLAAVLSDTKLDLDGNTISSTVTINQLAKLVGSKAYITPNVFKYVEPDISEGVSDAGYFLGRPALYFDSVSILLPAPLPEPFSLTKEYSDDFATSAVRLNVIENSLTGRWKSGFVSDQIESARMDDLKISIDSLVDHRSKRIALSWSP